jgi:thiol-disulfide isomerase/thioredoxin
MLLTERPAGVEQTGDVRILTALLAATVIALAGCGQQTGPPADGSGVVGAGKAADYDFAGTTLDGERFDGTRLEGKPAVLWFWAPWCPTCRAQIDGVSRLAERYDGKVAVVGVGGLDSEKAIRELAEQIPHVTHLVDHEGAVWRHFRVTEQSTYTVIDADGGIESEGYLDDDELAAMVARLAG